MCVIAGRRKFTHRGQESGSSSRWSVVSGQLARGSAGGSDPSPQPSPRGRGSEAAGILALVLWCFGPNILAYGHLITPDMGAAALGVAAGYVYWKWLKVPTWHGALAAGFVLGLAELTKFTLVVFVPVWVVLWLVRRCSCQWPVVSGQLAPGSAGGWAGSPAHLLTPSPAEQTPSPRHGESRRTRPAPKGRGREVRRELAQLAAAFLVCLFTINLGYAFDQSFVPLGNYSFVSEALAGKQEPKPALSVVGNRFHDTLLGSLPVPLPKDYLQGIDYSRFEFERGMRSYLNGQWKHGGWWYYYLDAMAMKIPLGTLAIGALALVLMAAGGRRNSEGGRRNGEESGVRSQESAVAGSSFIVHHSSFAAAYRLGLLDECAIWLPGLAILTLVSSQTGYNHHLRYVLPAFPFLLIGISRAALAFDYKHWILAALVGIAALQSTVSSLRVFPHSMSYFNELGGGPLGGHEHLVNSNIDWGQDLLYLRDWLAAHLEAKPLHLSYFGGVNPKLVGIDSQPVPKQIVPGWYAISVNNLHENEPLGRFLKTQPTAMAGYSIYIYHVAEDDLPKLNDAPATSEGVDRAGERAGVKGANSRVD
jgi:4-amino-4-deoxy-L-arabinose transferase-like glycosyltransferase